MTYGVDQCRRCGKAMRERRDNPKPDDLRPSSLTEAQWRAQGWLAKPTKTQQRFPSTGCCVDCTELVMRKRWKPGLRLALMFGAIIAFGLLGWWLLEIFLP